jgi:hypothetical protein
MNPLKSTSYPLHAKVVSSEVDYQLGYQQALADFGINDLNVKLSNYFNTNGLNEPRYWEEEDQDSLVSSLIQVLINSLNSKRLDDYLQALSSGSLEVLHEEFSQEIQPPSLELPINFVESAIPCYKDGSSLRWIPSKGGVDWGIAIGRFYAYAPHLYRWSWKYIILLDSHSPSAAWVMTDTAWEEDVELLEQEVAR